MLRDFVESDRFESLFDLLDVYLEPICRGICIAATLLFAPAFWRVAREAWGWWVG
jgi:hypothetical protein